MKEIIGEQEPSPEEMMAYLARKIKNTEFEDQRVFPKCQERILETHAKDSDAPI